MENAIREGGENSLGGHSCDIIGWGEDRIGDVLVPYWIARNSWGEGWGDKGFFLFERGIDSKLREAGLDNYLPILRMNLEHYIMPQLPTQISILPMTI